MNHDHQTSIRPECLRAADDFWVQPSGEEVREVLRRACLTGAQAARLLGMRGATGRGIRRYTGGDAPIPYPSWAILCDVAGLGKIWGDPAAARADDEGIEEDASGGVDVEWSEARAGEFVTALQGDDAAKDFLTLWRTRANVEDQVQMIDDLITGKTALTEPALGACRAALMRLRQAAYALAHAASANTFADSSVHVIELVVQRYANVAEAAEEKVRVIRQWAEMPV